MKPGSLPWLLRFELLLHWRNLWSSSQKWVVVLLGGVGVAGVWALWVLLRAFRDLLQGAPAQLPEPLMVPLMLGGLAVWVWMVCTAMQTSVQVMFERGDLDLLVSSPVSTRGIFSVRVLGVVLAVSVWWLLLGLVVGVVGLLLGTWRLMGVPLGFFTLGTLASSFGVAVTFLLVKHLGVQRTRTVIQGAVVVVGAVMLLVLQAPSLMVFPPEELQSWIKHLPSLSPLEVWPRSVWLEPLPTLTMVSLPSVLLAGVIWTCHPAYLQGVHEGGGASIAARKVLSSGPFRSSVLVLLWLKEWRLVLRDPVLSGQLLMQSFLVLPMAFVLAGGGRGMPLAEALNPSVWVAGVVLVSCNLTGRLVRIFIAAEDLPDLLVLAPHAPGVLRRQKMWVALLPVLMVFVPLTGWLGKSSLTLLFLGVGVVTGSGLVVAWLQHQWARPIKRADILSARGKGQGNVMQVLVELAVSIGWSGVVVAYGHQNLQGLLLALGAGVFFPAAFAFAGMLGRHLRTSFQPQKGSRGLE